MSQGSFRPGAGQNNPVRLSDITKYEAYQLLVDTVLKGNEVASGDKVTLRQFEHTSKTEKNHGFFKEFPMPRIGDSRLFVIGKNPDNATYGLYFGRFSRFDIDNNMVRYSNLDDAEVQFARDVSPTNFLANIQQEVSRQGPR